MKGGGKEEEFSEEKPTNPPILKLNRI